MKYVFHSALSRTQLANAEAFKAILTHEKIPFTEGVGPSGAVVEVADEDIAKVLLVIQQWAFAIADLYGMVRHQSWRS